MSGHLNRRMSKSSRRSSTVPGGVRALAGGLSPARTQSMPLSTTTRHSNPLSLSSGHSSSDAAQLTNSDAGVKLAQSLPPPAGTAEAAGARDQTRNGRAASAPLRPARVLSAPPRQKRVSVADLTG